MSKIISKRVLNGELVIPASKSDGQRAVLAAALTKNGCVIQGLGISDDEKAMLENIRSLGGDYFEKSKGEFEIKPIDRAIQNTHLSVGESGLGLRLITAVCAMIGEKFILTGNGSILTRDQHFFEMHLPQMGVRVSSNNGKLPLELRGKLKPGNYQVDGSESSQYVSGLLMTLPLLGQDSTLQINNLKSIPYVEMTLKTMSNFNVQVDGGTFANIKIKGNQVYESQNYTVESDWSSGSFWLVAAALGHDLKIKGLNMESLQADKAILEVFSRANIKWLTENNTIEIDGENREAFHFDATHCPDLFPILAVLAAFTPGTSSISGVHRLFNKESNRAMAIEKEISKIGAKVVVKNDALMITPCDHPKEALFSAHNDHRMAMSLAIASTLIEGNCQIEGAESVSKSYPDFWNDLEMLTQK